MYAFFVTGSLFLTVVGLVLRLVPFRRKAVRLLYHKLICFFTRALVYLAGNLKKRIIGRTPQTFEKASVIVANHSSFLDILCTTMLHPRLILLTNKWVWNSPVFGGVVRLADYYPVTEGADESIDRLKERVAEGYSVLVFPEGTRSADGKIGRFHKGAFYLAGALHVPVTPLLIHGAKDAIPKGSIYLNDAHITLRFLPPIAPDDPQFGTGYSERTRNISRYFKAEYRKLAAEAETPGYFRYLLTRNYLYKGPVLEWYMRIKLRLEKNYTVFNDLVPRKANVLDLGCGYGFLCYMLQLLSEERIITGVDYDDDKIEVARHGYLRSSRLSFYAADVMTFPLKPCDVIIISDVLHYLAPAAQEQLLVRCFKALNPGGRLIVRDGDADLEERQKGTALTEFFSVKLLGFNKSTQALSFVSGTTLKQLVQAHGLTVSVLDQTKYTSNVIFVIDKPGTAATPESLTTN
jgi:1-acyl-sn-glycerol-3-phosphate acyltransferase